MKKVCIISVLIVILSHPLSAQTPGDSAAGIAITEYSLTDLFAIALERSEKVKISEEDVGIAERNLFKAQ